MVGIGACFWIFLRDVGKVDAPGWSRYVANPDLVSKGTILSVGMKVHKTRWQLFIFSLQSSPRCNCTVRQVSFKLYIDNKACLPSTWQSQKVAERKLRVQEVCPRVQRAPRRAGRGRIRRARERGAHCLNLSLGESSLVMIVGGGQIC